MEYKISQKDRVLKYMRAMNGITTWEAIKEFGITRLSAKIYDLRKDGYNIKSKTIQSINRYGDITHFKQYFLDDSK